MDRIFENLRRQSESFKIYGLATLALVVSLTALDPAFAKDSQKFYPSDLIGSLKNWGIYSSSRSSLGAPRADISAVDAWRIQEGKPEVVVAVVDTGIDLNHRDLAKNLWHDPAQPKSGIFGKNFVNPGKNPIDDHGHGTHVAGIIDGELDPGLGVSGVAHHVSIMPLKYYAEGASGMVNLNHTIEAIQYAVDHGARIINYSGGGPEFSQREYEAIKRAEAKGILFIAAAGNEGEDIDQAKNYYFPASYTNPEVPAYRRAGVSRPSNMIVVAATNEENNLISASNWGAKSVDVAAPGENILSTLPNGRTGMMSGTSQATAFASGVAALILSENPRLTPQEVKTIMIQSSEHVDQLQGKVLAAGHLNVFEAVKRARTWVGPRLNILAHSQVTQ